MATVITPSALAITYYALEDTQLKSFPLHKGQTQASKNKGSYRVILPFSHCRTLKYSDQEMIKISILFIYF